MTDKQEYIGYHGTNTKYCTAIKKDNFKISSSDIEWLGHGAYFFIDGISCPVQNAREWAISEAWDKSIRCNTYKTYTILSVAIIATRVLDLTGQDGLANFNKFRDKAIKKYRTYFKSGRNIYSDDTYIYNLAIKAMTLDALINNLYIKTKEQRIKNIFSRTPNCTVMNVVNPANSVVLESIREIETGEIS